MKILIMSNLKKKNIDYSTSEIMNCLYEIEKIFKASNETLGILNNENKVLSSCDICLYKYLSLPCADCLDIIYKCW